MASIPSVMMTGPDVGPVGNRLEPKFNSTLMTRTKVLGYPAPSMSDWKQTGAFVLQFKEKDSADHLFEGRVEHVSSGEVLRFKNRDELLGFLEQVLDGDSTEDETGDW